MELSHNNTKNNHDDNNLNNSSERKQGGLVQQHQMQVQHQVQMLQLTQVLPAEKDNCDSGSSHSSSSSERLPYIFELIQQKQWKKIRKEIKTPKGKVLVQERDSSNLTCLALALAQAAPIEVIKDMYYTDPPILDVRDEYGATALHVGCLNGISVQSIEFILSKHPDLATILDYDNRSALHHSVEFICNDGNINDPDNMSVLKSLCDAAPDMINVQDNDGGTPIDLVQILKFKTKIDTKKYQYLDVVYHFLTNVAVKLYKNQRKQWEDIDGEQYRLALAASNDFDHTSASFSFPSHSTSTTILTMMDVSNAGIDDDAIAITNNDHNEESI